MAHKLRGSYSLFKTWENNGPEETVKQYLKYDRFVTEAMEEGLKYHKAWEKYIEEHKTLPKIFTTVPLSNPVVEKKIEISVAEWLDIVGVIDCYDDTTIYEFKTGVTDASTYGDSHQAEVYAWLLSKQGIQTKKAMYYHYNQHNGDMDSCLVWLTPERMQQAIGWALNRARDIHMYFLENGVYELQ